jgi:N-acyl-D-aspartate/D-glutamate deacylase
MKADLVMFDPATVPDMATFEQPHQYAQGISVVVINGQVAFKNGAMTAARPGRIVYSSICHGRLECCRPVTVFEGGRLEQPA